MHQAKRWRYYCDFCKRANMQKASMAKHERGCTLNPNRICGLCAHRDFRAKPIADLLSAFENGGWKAVGELTENCPACILAAIRQFNKAHPDIDEQIWPEDFDFKKEMTSFWNDVNSDAAGQYTSGCF